MSGRQVYRGALVVLLLAGFIAYFLFDLGRFLSLDYLQSRRVAIETWTAAHPLGAATTFFLIYVTVAALSLPGAAILSLAAGALFGLLWGTLLASVAATIGGTLAFLIARFLLHDWVQRRFRERLRAINKGVERDGAFYLFTLRLVALFPFFVINLVMALTPIRTWTFLWVSQLGMLPGALVYVNAGTQLARVDSPGDILSPGLIGAFALLGLFPLITRKLVDALKARRVYAGWQRPRRFDRNLIVIGAGSAGLSCAYIAATARARVSLIEKQAMGGDCLNTGCVPSKALIRSTRFLEQMRHTSELGIRRARVDFDFAEIMERVQRVVERVAPHDSVERYTDLGVDVIAGEARLTSPWRVEIRSGGESRALTARAIILATGARPYVPPIPGLETVDYLTSETVWSLRERPRRLVVLGGGPIGCELAQCFARLGSQVTLVEMGERLVGREDPEVGALLAERFESEGVELRLGHRAVECRQQADGSVLLCRDGEDTEVELPFDRILVAIGRQPNTAGLGLSELGIPLTAKGTLETNDFLQTRYPNIYACGDVAGPYQFTHTASHQAWYATINALFGRFRKFRVDNSVIPWATFTDPEIAHVGLNETAAREQGTDYEVTVYELAELDRAIAEGEDTGFVKVLTEPGKDRILGVTLVGPQAGELIAEFVLAMRQKIGLGRILGTIHVYPTLVEANKYAAGAWRKAHAPARLLDWVERLHTRARR